VLLLLLLFISILTYLYVCIVIVLLLLCIYLFLSLHTCNICIVIFVNTLKTNPNPNPPVSFSSLAKAHYVPKCPKERRQKNHQLRGQTLPSSNTPLKGEPSKPPRSQSEIRKVFEGAPLCRRLEGWQEIQEAARAGNPTRDNNPTHHHLQCSLLHLKLPHSFQVQQLSIGGHRIRDCRVMQIWRICLEHLTHWRLLRKERVLVLLLMLMLSTLLHFYHSLLSRVLHPVLHLP